MLKQKYASLSIFLILVATTKKVFFTPALIPPSAATIQALQQSNDPESFLAMGKKMPFSKLGIYELELIPGISERLAIRIIDHRREILEKARTLTEENLSSAFIGIYGVGRKTADKLNTKIDLLE